MAQQFDRFLIAPFDIGQETDLKPWMIPDQAFERMHNAYTFRGRIRKRFGGALTGTGYTDTNLAPLCSRVCMSNDSSNNPMVTDGSGNITATVPGNTFAIGQQFSIGTTIFTVNNTGTPGNMLRSDGKADPATYDTDTGQVVIENSFINEAVYFYPATPILGISQYEFGPVNNQSTFVFDTQFAYYYTGTYWTRSGTALWHSDTTNLYWVTNWAGPSDANTYMFVSNFQVQNLNGAVSGDDDPIWTYDGSTWATYIPKLVTADAGSTIATAKIILPFKNRLVMLNVVETDVAGTSNINYSNRCRFSSAGSSLPAATAWLNPNQAGYRGAGWIDAPTEEEIVSAGFIKDRLIVYFERSTYELVYTANAIQPFVWQKLNTELGSECLFSTVSFDRNLLTIGSTGIHACNGSNVARIDAKIPDEIFKIKNAEDGTARVVGIRDFYTELVYWSLPLSNQSIDNLYPNTVLVYNYANGSWATNDDTITAFGYFEQQQDITWEDLNSTWQEYSGSWNSGVVQSQFRKILAGNPQGYVFTVEPEIAVNAPVNQITDMNGTSVFIESHNLEVGDFINIQYTTMDGIYQVVAVNSDREVVINATTAPGYTGGGVASLVSRIDILSKQWNPYIKEGFNFQLMRIDFNVSRTSDGVLAIDYYPSYSDRSMASDAESSGALMGSSILETYPYVTVPFETVQSQFWHPVFLQTSGSAIQLRIYLDDYMMQDETAATSWFELHGIVLHARTTSRRLG